jgi:hypothetical protein
MGPGKAYRSGQRASMSFRKAIEDYRYLKNRDYPGKAALKLVGDRWRLATVERNCLFRAVFSEPECRLRRAKLVPPAAAAGRSLGVDWYNVLITVESYLKGFPVFLADDGLLRDSSGVHGSYRAGKVTDDAMQAILGSLDRLGLKSLELCLDSPISHSGTMAEELRERIASRLRIPFTVSLSPSADYPLKSFAGVVATSDSSIIDREGVREVLDLARFVLQSAYQAELPRVEQMFSGSAD